MPILGAIYGQTAIKKPSGGYAINDNATRNKYYGYTPPKKTAAPKVSAPKVSTYSAPKVSSPAPSIQTAAAPVAPAPAAPPPPSIDDLINKYYGQSTGDVNNLYDQQKNTQLAQLKTQRDAAIGKINQQQGVTKQDYYNQRNQADVVNAQNVQKLRELMAANGISASGENLTLNAKANSDRQNALGALNQQEQAKMNDYQSQITDWNNPSRDQAITSQIDAARTQALLNAKQQAYQKAWNDWQFNNMSASQQAQLAMGKYNTDSTNAANSSASQAALDYYNSMGFNGGSGGGGTLSGNSNSQKIWNYFKGKGLSTGAIAGIMGNLQQESSLNPGVNADGLAQWNGSRRTAMQNYARSIGQPSNSLEAQLGYLWQELSSGSGGLNVAQLNGLSASQAAQLFSNKFERPGTPMMNNRVNYANQFYNLYG